MGGDEDEAGRDEQARDAALEEAKGLDLVWALVDDQGRPISTHIGSGRYWRSSQRELVGPSLSLPSLSASRSPDQRVFLQPSPRKAILPADVLHLIFEECDEPSLAALCGCSSLFLDLAAGRLYSQIELDFEDLPKLFCKRVGFVSARGRSLADAPYRTQAARIACLRRSR